MLAVTVPTLLGSREDIVDDPCKELRTELAQSELSDFIQGSLGTGCMPGSVDPMASASLQLYAPVGKQETTNTQEQGMGRKI